MDLMFSHMYNRGGRRILIVSQSEIKSLIFIGPWGRMSLLSFKLGPQILQIRDISEHKNNIFFHVKDMWLKNRPFLLEFTIILSFSWYSAWTGPPRRIIQP